MRPTVAFVLCPGHSGSTLLGHFLGAHPRVLHIGEIVSPMRRGRAFRCRVCEVGHCPVWGSALREPFVKECLAQFHRDRWLPGPLAALGRSLSRQPNRRLALHGRLFDAVPATDVVVDSSKTLRWTAWNASGTRPLRIAVVHLTRDLRGVLASHLRRIDPDPCEQICRALAGSSKRILSFLSTRPPEDVTTVRYEDLVERPQEIGAELCRFLGLDFDPQMLEYYRVPQHVIGGNPGPTHQVRAIHASADHTPDYLDQTSPENQRFYRDQPPGFLADLRWKQELDAATLARFEAIAGEMNRRLGYASSG
jgi:hypothetical protein